MTILNANEIVSKEDFTQGCEISLCHTSRITQNYVIHSYQNGIQKLLNGDLDQAYLLFILLFDAVLINNSSKDVFIIL